MWLTHYFLWSLLLCNKSSNITKPGYLISSIHSPRLKLPGNGYLTQDCWIKGNPKGIICLNKGNEKALITGKRNKSTSFSATFRQRWGQVGEGRLKVAWVFWPWWLGTHASCITQLVWMGGDVYTQTHLWNDSTYPTRLLWGIHEIMYRCNLPSN